MRCNAGKISDVIDFQLAELGRELRGAFGELHGLPIDVGERGVPRSSIAPLAKNAPRLRTSPSTIKYSHEATNAARPKARRYYEANVGQIRGQMRRYREANADQIREQMRRYREANADQIREQARRYYEANADKIRDRAREQAPRRKVTHPEYHLWYAMKQRCTNPTNQAFKYYGGRGIRVCERWSNSYVAFSEDMGPRPSNAYTLERINNDGNYEPANWPRVVSNAKTGAAVRLP